MDELTLPATVAVWALPVIFAITVHEVAHGWMAKRLGDPTAQLCGRLTLNPIKHIDPVGTLVVPLVLVLVGSGFVMGWAKPVPVSARNLRRPRRDMAFVALAGPGANLGMAILWVLVAKLALFYHVALGGLAVLCVLMGAAGVLINVVLLVLNLLPWPPLDGGRVLTSLLPASLALKLGRLEPFGLLILLLLLATGMLGKLLSPPVSFIIALLARMGDIPAGIFSLL